MSPLTSAIVVKALDGLSTRLQVTAANIANANSTRFRPATVDFEASLREAAARGIEAVDRQRATIVPGAIAGGEQRLDLELETASETGMRYAALVNLLGREIDISRTAIRGGQ